MAPSPTGWIHIGTVRTFLFDLFMARQAEDGHLINRIEDTDTKRTVPGGIQGIEEQLALVGIVADEGPTQGGAYGPYIQTQRLEIYPEYAQRLIDSDHAYRCFCSSERLAQVKEDQKLAKMTPRYDGFCRNLLKEEVEKKIAAGEKYVVRLKVPKDEILTCIDPVLGKLTFNTNDVNDQILLKSDGMPTYHLAVVVDDILMKVTHAVRGMEYISSIPKQMLLYKYLGEEMPQYVHVPLILNPDSKGKLSKRKGNVALIDFMRKGYIKEGLINFLSLIGWNPDPKVAHQDEIYDLDFLIKNFDAKRIKKSAGRFQIEKMEAINSAWISKLSKEELYNRVLAWIDLVIKDTVVDTVRGVSEALAEQRAKLAQLKEYLLADKNRAIELLAITQQRTKTLSDVYSWLSVLFEDSSEFDYEAIALVLPDIEKKREIVYNLRVALEKLATWDQDAWEPAIRALADKYGMKHGDLFMVLRVIVTGKKISPPLREFMVLAGRDFVSSRFEKFATA
jgi:nondiscriminating glutamyl-tRNA synthetase